jgi:hypothetical protein
MCLCLQEFTWNWSVKTGKRKMSTQCVQVHKVHRVQRDYLAIPLLHCKALTWGSLHPLNNFLIDKGIVRQMEWDVAWEILSKDQQWVTASYFPYLFGLGVVSFTRQKSLPLPGLCLQCMTKQYGRVIRNQKATWHSNAIPCFWQVHHSPLLA